MLLITFGKDIVPVVEAAAALLRAAARGRPAGPAVAV